MYQIITFIKIHNRTEPPMLWFILSPTTILVENDNSDSTLSRQDTDLVLEGYEDGNDPKYSDRIQNQTDDRKATTGAVNSLADQIIINNIEEEEDESMDQDTEKGATTQIEYAPNNNIPYSMNKSLSTVSSNIGTTKF